MNPTTSRTLHRTAGAIFAAALLLSACGSSDSDGKEAKTTTTSADKTTTTADETTTTEADDETTTTEAGGDQGDGPTLDELTAVLPTATDFGEGWAEDDSVEQQQSAVEAATQEQCEAAAGVLTPAGDDDATVGFTGPAGETVRVTLSSGADEAGAELLQGLVDEINACDLVTASDQGFDYTIDFTAELNDAYGDEGFQLAAAVNLSDGTNSVDANKYRLLFRSGRVGVTISAGDAVNDDFTSTPIDGAGLEAVATEMATRVGSL